MSSDSKILQIVPSPSTPSTGACSSAGVSVIDAGVADAPLMSDKGFSGNVALVTLGCAKNTVDSEVMLGALSKRGFTPVTETENADLIIVNTCGFLQSAVEEGVDRILELSELKQNGRCRELWVAGCMVERYRAELVESMPEVDRFLSTDEILKVAESKDTTEDCLDAARRPYFIYDETAPRILSTAGHTAYVKIAEGCDRPCSFCIIPKLRGAFRSRPERGIVDEIGELLSLGVKEINLIAQDLTSYGSDHEGANGKSKLPRLLDAIAKQHQGKDFWLRLLYAYPIGTDSELIETIMKYDFICKYLDIPLQHVSKNVLKAMRRPLGGRRTRDLVEQIRREAPELALRTTFIVGFPGETQEDVDELSDFVAEGHFKHVGVFCYSQEKEALSYSYENQIDAEVKEARRAQVMQAQQSVVSRNLAEAIGKQSRVLIEGAHADTDLLVTARTQWQMPEDDGEVIINDVADQLRLSSGEVDLSSMIGKFGVVEFSEVTDYDLVASLQSVED